MIPSASTIAFLTVVWISSVVGAAEPPAASAPQEEMEDAQPPGALPESPREESQVVFTLTSGINIPIGSAVWGYLKPGVNVSGDLMYELKAGTEFKFGMGVVSDYTAFFINSAVSSGAQAFWNIGPVFKPTFRLRGESFSVTEISGGYTLKHSYGTNLGSTSNAFGFLAGTGISLKRFIFGARYRMAIDDNYAHKWVSIYIGALL